jgi:hypothetical protein
LIYYNLLFGFIFIYLIYIDLYGHEIKKGLFDFIWIYIDFIWIYIVYFDLLVLY